MTSTVLEKFDHRIENLDRIQAMMIERSNLLVDVDYAKRKVLPRTWRYPCRARPMTVMCVD